MGLGFQFSDLTKNFPLYKQDGCAEEASGSSGEGFGYFEILLAFGLMIFLVEQYLSLRQYRNFVTIKKIPELLKGHITDTEFDKSQVYNADKQSFALFEGIVVQVMSVGGLCLGMMPFIWDKSVMVVDQYLSGPFVSRFSIWTGPVAEEAFITCVFVLLTTLVETLTSMPLQLYSKFVIEERHGFNKSTLGLYLYDTCMQLVLTAVLGSPIIAGLVALIRNGGAHFYIYVWAMLFCASLFFMTIFPEYIAPLFNKYEPLPENTPERKAIDDLARRVDFPLTKVFVMDGSKRSAHSNAFFFGMFKNKRIVLFDTLIKQVTLDELLAILGHEIGHWALGHTMQGFCIMQLYIFLMFFAFSTLSGDGSFVADFGFSSKNVPCLVELMLFQVVMLAPAEKMSEFAMNMLSRSNEFAADAYAKDLGMGINLASGLVKLQKENLGNMVPDALYSMYHFTHPPVVERMAQLKPYRVTGVVVDNPDDVPSPNESPDKVPESSSVSGSAATGPSTLETLLSTDEGLEKLRNYGVLYALAVFVGLYGNYVGNGGTDQHWWTWVLLGPLVGYEILLGIWRLYRAATRPVKKAHAKAD